MLSGGKLDSDEEYELPELTSVRSEPVIDRYAQPHTPKPSTDDRFQSDIKSLRDSVHRIRTVGRLVPGLRAREAVKNASVPRAPPAPSVPSPPRLPSFRPHLRSPLPPPPPHAPPLRKQSVTTDEIVRRIRRATAIKKQTFTSWKLGQQARVHNFGRALARSDLHAPLGLSWNDAEMLGPSPRLGSANCERGPDAAALETAPLPQQRYWDSLARDARETASQTHTEVPLRERRESIARRHTLGRSERLLRSDRLDRPAPVTESCAPPEPSNSVTQPHPKTLSPLQLPKAPVTADSPKWTLHEWQELADAVAPYRFDSVPPDRLRQEIPAKLRPETYKKFAQFSRDEVCRRALVLIRWQRQDGNQN